MHRRARKGGLEGSPMHDLIVATLFTAMLLFPCVVANFGASGDAA